MNRRLGERIVMLRQAKGWSQAQLARELGIKSARLSTWERGRNRPPSAMLGQVAEILETSADYLLTGKVEPRDLRFYLRLPLLEALPAELRDILIEILDGVALAHRLAVSRSAQAQPDKRPSASGA